jgi:hypothetical protein
MKDIKKILNIGFWTLIFGIILLNMFLLNKVKQNALGDIPLEYLEIKKPTIIILLDEYACISCVQGLLFFNDIYMELHSKNDVDIKGVILSESKTDKKNITQSFIFPFVITNNFDILRRLNLNKTPVILGMSKDHRIFYSDFITKGSRVTPEFIKNGVLDRLYFSLNNDTSH